MLPPRTRRPAAAGAPDTRGLLSGILAHWLDDVLKIPGTRIRFGLDPLLALIPAFGDAAVTGAGATLLLSAARHRAPPRLILRMAANMLGNALLNAVPLAGPALSIWFKSNTRNYRLLQRHLAGLPPGPPSRQSRVLIGLVVLIVLAIIGINIAIWAFIFSLLAAALGGGR